MNHTPFREHHLLQLLSEYDPSKGPLDRFMARYFQSNRSLGSKDRAYIANTAYQLVRWQALLDHLGKSSWPKRLQTLQNTDLIKASQDSTIPNHIRTSTPKELFDLLEQNYGTEKAIEIALACNTAAPTTIRVNRCKTNREKLLKQWKNQYDITPCIHSLDGIVFHKKINFYETPEYRKGLFSVQDEASQLVANLVQPGPKDHVLDFCAGSGGKALAIAPHMKGKGQLYLHDIREYALQEAKQRLKKAGVQNAQIVTKNSSTLKKIKGRCDWVLVDAPCSGTGTLRRNPDMKWRFSIEMLERLIVQQREIFAEALSFLQPSGKIVFATCSILQEENQQQIDFFLKEHNLSTTSTPSFMSLPKIGEMDGFFGCTLSRV